jgi:hypothetical protein
VIIYPYSSFTIEPSTPTLRINLNERTIEHKWGKFETAIFLRNYINSPKKKVAQSRCQPPKLFFCGQMHLKDSPNSGIPPNLATLMPGGAFRYRPRKCRRHLSQRHPIGLMETDGPNVHRHTQK